jgi:hypothetical protein
VNLDIDAAGAPTRDASGLVDGCPERLVGVGLDAGRHAATRLSGEDVRAWSDGRDHPAAVSREEGERRRLVVEENPEILEGQGARTVSLIGSTVSAVRGSSSLVGTLTSTPTVPLAPGPGV